MELARVVVHLTRLRPWAVVALLAALTVLMASTGHTVPSIAPDPTIPPTPTPLLVATMLASIVVLLLRPVLPEAERLSAANMRGARAVAVGAVTLLAGGTAALAPQLVTDPPSVTPCLGTAAALVGLALGLAPLGSFASLSLPLLYVVSGLAFGYRPSTEGPARVRSWAWLVEPASASLVSELVVAVVGLAVFVLVPPRIDRD
ncbi:hypothetical protein [Nocardioides stalactiti]|uniref:hypothetical protein n=1 Tax=Nocardioides stalactiti TaxID=2755356 RepID=UPI0016012D16|nr:hypothetical protein [Nocardioides stalactiti]